MIHEKMQIRSQPVRAVQWTGWNWDEILRFVGEPVADERNSKPLPGWTKHGYFEISIEDSHNLMVPTPFGRVSAEMKDWIVEDEEGFRPVSSEVFTCYYAPAEVLEDEEDDKFAEAYVEGVRDGERAVPPLLRRFFWWDKDTLTSPRRPVYWGNDEYCNTTVGIRLKGGVLFVRTGRKVRLDPSKEN